MIISRYRIRWNLHDTKNSSPHSKNKKNLKTKKVIITELGDILFFKKN